MGDSALPAEDDSALRAAIEKESEETGFLGKIAFASLVKVRESMPGHSRLGSMDIGWKWMDPMARA